MSLHQVFTRRSSLVIGLFFGLLVVLGIWLHRDYGVSADEPNNHLNGLVQIKYVAQLIAPDLVRRQPSARLIPDIQHFSDADHGPAFELPLAVVSYVFTHGDARAFYFLRHLSTFLVFLGGCYALLRLAAWRLGHWGWGLLAAGLLLASPRLFAEAFYNGKDVVFLALFTLAVYTLLCLLLRPTPARALLHALATALAVDVRVHGLLILVLTWGLLALPNLASEPAQRGSSTPNWLKIGLLYTVACIVFVVAGWPYLWSKPISDLWHDTARVSHYPWEGTVLYWGHVFQLPTERLPWHYIPVWILITTPVFYTFTALMGLVGTLCRLLRQGRQQWQTVTARMDLLLVLWLLGPVVFVAAFHGTVYNGWRHLYFVYPALVLLAASGVRMLCQVATRYQAAMRVPAMVLLLLGSLEAAYTVVRMVRMHPYQNVYFSFLPPTTAERLFELDYWGLSYRGGLEWILAHDPAPEVTYCGNPGYLDNNSLVLPPEQRARLRYVRNPVSPELPSEARYFLTAYHYYGGRNQSYPDSLGKEVYTIRADGLRIFSVFKRR